MTKTITLRRGDHQLEVDRSREGTIRVLKLGGYAEVQAAKQAEPAASKPAATRSKKSKR